MGVFGGAQSGSELESAALMITMDISAVLESEFNDWYDFQHLPERLSVPGFFRARRFVAARNGSANPFGKYLTIYDTTSLEALRSSEYLERLNHPTEWTTRMVSSCQRVTRTVCCTIYKYGDLSGGRILLGRFAADDTRAVTATITTLLQPLVESRLAVSIHILEDDQDVTMVKTATREGASARETSLEGTFVIIDLSSRARPEDVRKALTSAPLQDDNHEPDEFSLVLSDLCAYSLITEGRG